MTTKQQFVVQSNVPLPAMREKAIRHQYPFATMGVGDSFLIPVPPEMKSKAYAAVSQSWRNYNKDGNTAIKFAGRKVEGGVRVWRIS